MADTIPVAQLRAFVERIERIEADIKDLNSDKSEVYKELRGCGFDVKAVRAVVAKRKLDTADREERDAMFDLYWSALTGSSRVHVHEAETHPSDRGGSNPDLNPSAAHGAGASAAPIQGSVGRDYSAGSNATASLASDESEAPHSHSQAAPPPADKADAAHSSLAASATPIDDFEPVAFLRKPAVLRPDCQHPDNCAGYGAHTCHACKAATSARESVEA